MRRNPRAWLLASLALCFVLSVMLGIELSAQEGAKKAAEKAIPKADLDPNHFGVRLDPSKVEGPMECAACHPSAFMAWKASTHGMSFNTRHRSKKAKKIADRMGIKRFRSADSLCSTCHTTMKEPEAMETPMAIAGPSCESCHGESEAWLNDHFNFGGADMRKDETKEHRKKRLKMLREKGMTPPSDLFAISQNCYSCHVVTNSSLVEIGGHPTGSEIELVPWTQGEMRHNFVDSRGKKNAEGTLAHRRVLLLAGFALEAEWGLRQMAASKEEQDLYFEGQNRVESALWEIKRAKKALGDKAPKALDSLLKALGKIEPMKFQKATVRLEEAKKIKVLGTALGLELRDAGEALGALDAFLPKSDDYQGKAWMPKPAANKKKAAAKAKK